MDGPTPPTAGITHPLYVLVPHTGSRAVREAEDAGDVVVEVCERCWGPVLRGKLDDHLRAIPHRLPPLETGGRT